MYKLLKWLFTLKGAECQELESVWCARTQGRIGERDFSTNQFTP